MIQANDKYSYLRSANADYIETLYQEYLANPDSIDPTWRYFFEGVELGEYSQAEYEPSTQGDGNGYATAAQAAATPKSVASFDQRELKVAALIEAYRCYGHFEADLNPLEKQKRKSRELSLETFGLSDADLSQNFQAGALIGIGAQPLSKILEALRSMYCQTVGVEVGHIGNRAEREWVTRKIETGFLRAPIDHNTKKFILTRLTAAECFERFLHTRFVAQKRFSVEGGENSLTFLDSTIENGTKAGISEFVVGMAHRGRLNVLTNLFGKKPEHVFTEFEGNYSVSPDEGEGDVKYHKGWLTDSQSMSGRPARLVLSPNPSHLEFVNPVIEGMARARQDLLKDHVRDHVLPILIHGDAAFAGQGVCYETINMSQLASYATGGTIHVVINNQVGFTTSPKDSRSTPYSTDLARSLDSPIIHVNGDDAETVWKVAELSIEYRQKFKKDIFIDIVCYRKHGHNEGDEPTFTQPLLYGQIKAHESPREVYAQKLAQTGVLSTDLAQKAVDDKMNEFQAALVAAKTKGERGFAPVFVGEWKDFKVGTEADNTRAIKTRVDAKTLIDLGTELNTIPKTFHLHPKLGRFFEARLKAIQDQKGIDWGNGEALAYATLITEGHPVRISGQDAERGTFTHRHAVLNDVETGEKYTPHAQLRDAKAKFEVYNSHLSETAAMGFEFGYSTENPKALTVWEAQFGDFANGAQVIIDQFIASSESKWKKTSGLTLLLPHGYEGQGPEHSSARLERFLQLCGRNNMIVANLTTPAQIFHALRRQVKRDFRKPLVVMSPKSLLRHPLAISKLEEFTNCDFAEVIDEIDSSITSARNSVTRIVLCSGKVYYDLVQARADKKRGDIAIIRVEQLYPWPEKALQAILSQYPKAKEVVWTQDEPLNMGAWQYVFSLWSGGTGNFGATVKLPSIRYVGRPMAAAPAVGSPKVHDKQQKNIIEETLS